MTFQFNEYQQPSTITIEWSSLTEEQKLDLYNQSLQERNLELIEFCYWKMLTEPNFNMPLKYEYGSLMSNQILIEKVKSGDIELLKWLLCDLSNKNEDKIKRINSRMLDWAIKNECLDIIYQIELNQLDIRDYNELLAICLYAGHITVENKINNANPVYQYILEELKNRKMDLLHRMPTILIIAIRFREKFPGLLELVYENYLCDKNFLIHCVIPKKNLRLPQKKKKNLMNGALDEALIYKNKYDVIDYLIQRGADFKNRNGKFIQEIIQNNFFHYVDLITKSGINIKDYKEKALQYVVKIDVRLKKFNQPAIEYLINLFDDKKEAWNLIEKHESREDVTNHWRSYISNMILEKDLQKNLEEKEEIAQHKI